MIRVDGNTVTVETKTLRAAFADGRLASLKRASDGREFLDGEGAKGCAPLALYYPGTGAAALTGNPDDAVTSRSLGDNAAEIRFEAWHGDGLLEITTDDATGDVIVEPSGFASRPGLQSCRWAIGGIADGLELVAPFFQGVKLPLSDPLLSRSRWAWPHHWEAGFAILQGADEGGGFWVHCEDDRYRFKALHVDGVGRGLGFEVEPAGPIDRNLAAGGLAWRLNVYDGDWKVPAGRYRDWLESAYQPLRVKRPAWMEEVRFAISWCPCDEALVDAVAKRIEPSKVLLHVPRWRTDPYDENYPTYVASAEGKRFVEHARSRGFRVMPHMNSVDMDPTHPVYATVRDFQYRDVVTKRVQGWVWGRSGIREVPESNAARLKHRDMKTMIKVHPGLATWRSILAESVAGAVADLGVDAAFLDVTLCTWNTDNGTVQYQTTSEGMKRIIEKVATMGAGLAVGGEGRNEITMLPQTFGQVHLFNSHQKSCEGLDRAGGTPVNEFLFGAWCCSFGYSNLGGATEDSALRMDVHTSLGAVPTVTVRSADEIEKPNPAVAKMLEMAGD